jgi:hypothetical protein
MSSANMVTTPDLSLPADANNGGITPTNNLCLFYNATSITFLYAGNHQVVVAKGNVFQEFLNLFSVGTNVSADIGPNVYYKRGDTNAVNFRIWTWRYNGHYR